jgi:CheY-like chemotaxis protein
MALSGAKRPLVVLADDDEFHSEIVAMWLDRNGFDVVKFPTGDELLAWAQGGADTPPHAFLLDVEMPGRDGFQVHEELRRLPPFQATPTLFVSGIEHLPERARAAGADGFLKDQHLLPRISAWLTTERLPNAG